MSMCQIAAHKSQIIKMFCAFFIKLDFIYKILVFYAEFIIFTTNLTGNLSNYQHK